MTRRTKRITAAVVLVLVLGGGAVAFSRSPYGAAMMKSRSQFVQSEADARVFYEPGMEVVAAMVAGNLPESVTSIERQQYLPMAKPFRVYVCATQESFNGYMGAPPGATARGVKVLNDVFLSPAAFYSDEGDTHEGVLTHELSHLHLYQRLGHRRSLWDMPAWFLEGLAVVVSGAGGRQVTEREARGAILSGYHFVPDDRGGTLRPKRAADYGIGTFMFYRQSELFVRFIGERDPTAFKSFMLALQERTDGDFASAFAKHFGTDVTGMWAEFEAYLNS